MGLVCFFVKFALHCSGTNENENMRRQCITNYTSIKEQMSRRKKGRDGTFFQNLVTFEILYWDDWHQLYLNVYEWVGCACCLCVCVHVDMIDMVNWKGQLLLVFGSDRQTVHISWGNQSKSHLFGPSIGKEIVRVFQNYSSIFKTFFYIWCVSDSVPEFWSDLQSKTDNRGCGMEACRLWNHLVPSGIALRSTLESAYYLTPQTFVCGLCSMSNCVIFSS